MVAPENRWHFSVWLLAALLMLATIILYWPATRCGFVSYDDPATVAANPRIDGGLSWEGVKWAFLNPVSCNWLPLTVITHMLDCQLFGLNPWGHHLVNVLFHSINVALVFALLKQLTGATWRSLLVAALFAFHPLHVESVAWITERKDVLSGFFGLLALIFYTRYARKRATVKSLEPKAGMVPALNPQRALQDYLLAFFFLALGLLSKPMLVTWPFVMLLLDYWPLERFRLGNARRLIVEKVPFLVLTVAASIVTFIVQKQAGAMDMIKNLPLDARIENALVSYCRYLGKMIWPTNLAVFYPHPGYWSPVKALLAGGLLAGLSVFFWAQRRRYPFLLMGWLWFCGTLAPVIGLVQIGVAAMADRYAYIPSVGIFIIIIWGSYELTRHSPHHVQGLTITSLAALVLCMVLTWRQLGYWQDSETLFRHALAVTENNYLAHNSLGAALDKKHDTGGAISQYQEAIRLKPDYYLAHDNLGIVLAEKGRIDEAINEYQQAIRINPDYPPEHYDLGNALIQEGLTNAAIGQFQEAIRLKPDYDKALQSLGTVLGRAGRTSEAIAAYREAVRLKPDNAQYHFDLGIVLVIDNQIDNGIAELQEAILLQPDFKEAKQYLDLTLQVKNGTRKLLP